MPKILPAKQCLTNKISSPHAGIDSPHAGRSDSNPGYDKLTQTRQLAIHKIRKIIEIHAF